MQTAPHHAAQDDCEAWMSHPFVTWCYYRDEACWLIEYQSPNGDYAHAQTLMVVPLSRRWETV